MIKKITFLLPVLAIVIFASQPKSGHSFSTAPPVFNAGAPGMSTCGGNNCHASNEVNAGDGLAGILIDEGLTNYMPGETYTVNLTISKDGASRFGFEMVAFDADGNSQGTFIPTTNDVSTTLSSEIEYVHHQSIPSSNEGAFSFSWTAPDSDVGEITFYTAANAANGNGNANGDFIYTTSVALTALDTMMNGIADIPVLNSNIYPNPTNDVVFVSTENDSPLTIRVYDLMGKLLIERVNVNSISLKENLQSGMYLLEMTDGVKTAFKRVVLK